MESSNSLPLDLISIGEVTAPHGVHGQLRVTMLTDFPERWRALKQVYLTPPPGTRAPRAADGTRPPAGPQLYQVTATRVLGGAKTRLRGRIADPDDAHTGPWGGQIHQVLLKLAGVDSPEAAGAFRGYRVEIPRAEAWPLPPGTYYTYQLEGLRVVTPAGTPVGKVVDILTTGSNDVYVLHTPAGGELLVPAIKDIVEEIDPAGGTIRIKDPAEWLAEEEAPPPARPRRTPPARRPRSGRAAGAGRSPVRPDDEPSPAAAGHHDG